MLIPVVATEEDETFAFPIVVAVQQTFYLLMYLTLIKAYVNFKMFYFDFVTMHIDLLQGLLGLRKTVILVITVYCSERIQIKMSKGKSQMGKD